MNGSTSDSNVTIPLSVKASFCVTMPLITGDEEFCNITEVWKPRYTSSALWIVPTFLAVVVTLLSWVVFFMLGRVKENEHPLRTKPRFRVRPAEDVKLEASCLDKFPGVKTMRSYYNTMRSYYNRIDQNISLLALVVAKQIWEIFDVYKDSRYFYDIEASGSEVLSINIYRNTAVSDAIYTLALFGVLKIPLSIFFMCLVSSPSSDSITSFKEFDSEMKETLFYNKFILALVAMIAFVFEDCAEAFLEYFYAEKYSMKGNFALYMIIADVVMSVKLLYSVMKYSSTGKTGIKLMRREGEEEKDDYIPFQGCFSFTLCVCYILMAIANVIRTYGALFQAVTGKLDVGCLAVESGRLIQTPFTTGGQCMRHVEYAMIIFNFAPFLWLMLLVFMGWAAVKRGWVKL